MLLESTKNDPLLVDSNNTSQIFRHRLQVIRKFRQEMSSTLNVTNGDIILVYPLDAELSKGVMVCAICVVGILNLGKTKSPI